MSSYVDPVGVGKMEDGNSYQIKVREYKNKKFLSTSIEGSTLTKIEDIGPVEDGCRENEEEDNLHTHKRKRFM